MKMLYIQIEQNSLNADEKKEYELLKTSLKKSGYIVAERNAAEEKKGACEKQTVTKNTTEKENFICVVLADTQKKIDSLSEMHIPVIGYERTEGQHLSCPYLVLSLKAIDAALIEKVYARYYEIPLLILETRRCQIREISMSDMDALFSLYEPAEITKYTEPLYDPLQEIEYEKAYIKNVYAYYEYGMWVVIEKKTQKLIGRAGIESREGMPQNTVEIGYVIQKNKQQKGYATEVCQAIMQYAFQTLGKEKIIARVNPANSASIRLLQKLGFMKTDEYDRQTNERIYICKKQTI